MPSNILPRYQYHAKVEPDNNSLGRHPNIVVVLGWYPLRKFLTKYDETYYATAGNLFDGVAGTQKLLTNLLFNPLITEVVLCNITKEDYTKTPCLKAKDTLQQFVLDNGRPLTDYLNLHVVNSEAQLQETLTHLSCKPVYMESSRPQQILEVKQVVTNIKPAFPIGQTYHAATIEKAHIEMLRRIRNNGVIEGNLQELISLSVTVTDEYQHLSWLDTQDKATKDYCLSYIHGSNSDMSYGYGDRLNTHFGFNQTSEIIQKLKQELSAKSAVLSLFEPQDLIKGKSPCLTQIWVRVREGKLHLVAIFRSNDMYRAWKLNAYALRALQIHICDMLGDDVEIGTLTTISFSAHVYEDNYGEIDEVLKAHTKIEQKYEDAVGNFLINYYDEHIKITHLSPNSEFIKEYSGNNDKLLIKEIVRDIPTIEPLHIAYLGRELLICSQKKEGYVQDKY